METFEEAALQCCPLDCRHTIWKGHVNDTFVITPRDKTNQLSAHLNSLKPSIRFAIEIKENNTITFLDNLVHMESDGKPTHTDQY